MGTSRASLLERATRAWNPPQPYAAAKRAAEMLGYTYNKHYGLNFTATRFFTVYGPRGRPDMMPGLLAESLYYGKQIPLHEGDIRRDWTFVEDTVNVGCQGARYAFGL